MPATPMSEPHWPGEVRQCLSCGYSLRGLGTTCRCPECGFVVDDRTLILHGVLNRGVSASPLRAGLWAVVFALGIALGYTWTLLILAIGWLYMVVLFFCWLGLLAVLIATSRRERAGRFALVFTVGGFLPVVDLDDERPEGEPIGWDRVGAIQLDRVSPVWRKLRIYGEGRTLLNAGVRCPDDLAERVFRTLETYRLERGADGPAADRVDDPGTV